MAPPKKISASEKGMVAWIKRGVMLVIVFVVLFSDTMFIKLMYNHFPDGWIRILALTGAVATGLSIILLVLAKQYWFRPGEQMHAAIGFTGFEVIASILNVLVASGIDIPYWLMVSPATPFISLCGWIVIIMLDQTTKDRHEDMEMEDEIAQSERDLRRAEHQARMEVRYKAIEYNKQYMIEALENPDNQRNIALGAQNLTASAIQQLTGRYVPPPSSQSVSLAQTAEVKEPKQDPQ